MITVVNFANDEFRGKQKWNTFTAKYFGKADQVISYTSDSIDAEYIKMNADVLHYKKGFGNYFWKPYIILKAFNEIKENDYLFYADSGSIFLKDIHPLVDFLNSHNKNIVCFRLPLLERQWTKRDAFILLDCDSDYYTDTPQIMGTFILLKKCSESEEFLKEFQQHCLDRRILSDDQNVMGKPNYPEFIAHRHDQSILSLLCKKHHVLITGDLSDYGLFPSQYIHKENYLFQKEYLNHQNNIFGGMVLCNRKVHPIVYTIKFYFKKLLAKFNYY